ncbi:ABC transporter substrate-binding protein [Sediminivirga luteola]|uniref:ABC transporter substrate-binding protein n=1 Tax=Sediminivirga luteola TaxID=1774748 RepID=A0A8J2TYF4_9MICO|nr:ABC transporter substrate-binding protein [Sediminivirga luteola]MCI2265982.1 ABC transporter substrate-binding protein [Sediminivirga luteola]GGA16577.1 ABC transporter substrate-binding protein [Sediminivirga luteola]
MNAVLRNTTPKRVLGAAAALASLAALGACGGGAAGEEGSEEGLSLVRDGALTICANLATPPNIFTDEAGEPQGAEVDIAEAMAENLGLEPDFREFNFSGLIPALQGGQCDVIISSLYIRPEREEIADFVPYLLSGSAVAVSEENPAGITGYDDTLCGVRALGITGATGAGLLEEKSEECEAEGKPGIDITLTDRAADGLQQVIAGQQDAMLDTAELAGYFEMQSEGAFQLVGEPFGEIEIGAATLKGVEGVHEALMGAFEETVESGRYAEILAEWGLEHQDIANA